MRVGTEEASRLDRTWERLSTDGLTRDETVDAVLARWPIGTVPETRGTARGMVRGASAVSGSSDAAVADRAAQVLAPEEPGRLPARVLWVTGPRCAGSSTVGWLLAAEAWQRDRRTGFIDLAQLSFTWNLGGSVGLDNGVALGETFAEDGAEQLVVVAPLEVAPAEVLAAFSGAEVRVIRLSASARLLQQRALDRTRGLGPLLPGDDLFGASAADAEALVDSALARQRIAPRLDETLVDTDGLEPAEAMTRVATAAGW